MGGQRRKRMLSGKKIYLLHLTIGVVVTLVKLYTLIFRKLSYNIILLT